MSYGAVKARRAGGTHPGGAGARHDLLCVRRECVVACAAPSAPQSILMPCSREGNAPRLAPMSTSVCAAARRVRQREHRLTCAASAHAAASAPAALCRRGRCTGPPPKTPLSSLWAAAAARQTRRRQRQRPWRLGGAAEAAAARGAAAGGPGRAPEPACAAGSGAAAAVRPAPPATPVRATPLRGLPPGVARARLQQPPCRPSALGASPTALVSLRCARQLRHCPRSASARLARRTRVRCAHRIAPMQPLRAAAPQPHAPPCVPEADRARFASPAQLRSVVDDVQPRRQGVSDRVRDQGCRQQRVRQAVLLSGSGGEAARCAVATLLTRLGAPLPR